MAWNKKDQQQQQNKKPASQQEVGKILDQVKENLESKPEESLASQSVQVENKVERKKQHPKFDKFKKGTK